MDDGLKQRLIGALVLLALAVIFIPAFFERERVEPLDRRTQIPIAPEVRALPDIPLKPMPQMDLVEEPKTALIPNENQVVPPSDASAETKESQSTEQIDKTEPSLPESWVLQVASYRFAAHAEELRDTLRKDGVSAFTRKVNTDIGKMTRLYIGPKIDRAQLEKIKPELDKKYNIDTLLLRFTP